MRTALVAILFSILILSGNAVGDGPNGQGASAKACFNCHKADEVKKAAFIHGPVNLGACDVCHTPHDGKSKTKLTARGNDLCFSCHEASYYQGKVEHAPVRKSCVGCHAPHGGKTYSLLTTSASQLCQTCHAGKSKQRQVARGDCVACHDPHRSKLANLLRPRAPKGACRRDRSARAATRIGVR